MLLAEHVGRDVTITAFGMPWHFTRWGRRTWVDFTAEAQKHLPNPLLEANAVLSAYTKTDAETLRELIKADKEEAAKAAAEGREPVLVSDKFRPNSDLLVEKALDKRGKYLGFGSGELESFLHSVAGSSYAFYLLLKPEHKDITEDDAYEIMREVGPMEQARILKITQGTARQQSKNESVPAA